MLEFKAREKSSLGDVQEGARLSVCFAETGEAEARQFGLDPKEAVELDDLVGHGSPLRRQVDPVAQNDAHSPMRAIVQISVGDAIGRPSVIMHT